MVQSKVKILLVEDDLVLGYVIKDFLQKQRYAVTHCTDGAGAWSHFMKHIYDLCLVDIMLPGTKDGLELANNIRAKNEQIPIILLTSKNMDDDKIEGFESGADSYLTKPCNFQELAMRIQVFLKRSRNKENTKQVIFHIGHLNFDHNNLTICDGQKEHLLTQREADLLRYFCMNSDRIITRNEILLNIWGKDDFFLGRSMDVFITKIRKYISAQTTAKLQTIHGQGFMFVYGNDNGTAKKTRKKPELQLK